MAESFHLCAWKKILWYRSAAKAYPTARYFGIADDDAFVQLAHLEADLRSVASSSGYVLYGLIMWKAYYNRYTLEPTKQFGGWQHTDAAAVSMRQRLDRCARALQLPPAIGNASHVPRVCAKLPPKELPIVREGALDQTPPYPFANGPLFVVSRPLATLLGSDAYPNQWLAQVTLCALAALAPSPLALTASHPHTPSPSRHSSRRRRRCSATRSGGASHTCCVGTRASPPRLTPSWAGGSSASHRPPRWPSRW